MWSEVKLSAIGWTFTLVVKLNVHKSCSSERVLNTANIFSRSCSLLDFFSKILWPSQVQQWMLMCSSNSISKCLSLLRAVSLIDGFDFHYYRTFSLWLADFLVMFSLTKISNHQSHIYPECHFKGRLIPGELKQFCLKLWAFRRCLEARLLSWFWLVFRRLAHTILQRWVIQVHAIPSTLSLL